MHRKNSLVQYSDDHELLRTEGGMFEDLAWLGGCLEGLESVWSLGDKVFWAGGIYIRNLRGNFDSLHLLWRDLASVFQHWRF